MHLRIQVNYQFKEGGRVDKTFVGKRAKGSNLLFVDHFGGRLQLTVVQLVTIPDLLELYVLLCHSKFLSHDCHFPRSRELPQWLWDMHLPLNPCL